jgi:hypothetical protein
LRGLEAATSGDLGDGTGESCAAERGGHAEGHSVVCVFVGEVRLEGSGVEWGGLGWLFAMLGFGRVRVETGRLMELGWSAPRCDGGPGEPEAE